MRFPLQPCMVTACLLLCAHARAEEFSEFGRIRGARREHPSKRYLDQAESLLHDPVFKEDSLYWERLLDEVSYSLRSSSSYPPTTTPGSIQPPTPSPTNARDSTTASPTIAATKPLTAPPTVESVFDPLPTPPGGTMGGLTMGGSRPSPSPTLTPTPPPTTTSPTQVPTTLSNPDTSFVRELVLTFARYGGDEFLHENYYQHKALTWLEGNAQVALYSVEQIKQRYALACIYFATYAAPNGITGSDVPGWLSSDDWVTDENECFWFGIYCDANGNIFAIDLSFNSLSGVFPPEVALLNQTLVDLRLTSNLLHNPGELFNAFLGELQNLEVLLIGENQFEHPGIPSEIGLLSNLLEFECYSTGWHGPLDGAVFANMPNLKYMDISSNPYNSPIPVEIGLLPSILELWASGNPDLTGSIPKFIGTLDNLASLNVKDCSITGVIPSEIGQLTGMRRLFLNGNELVGEVPQEVGNMMKLEMFRIEDNNIEGTMPDSVCELVADYLLAVLTADCTNSTMFECSCCSMCFPCTDCDGATGERTGRIQPNRRHRFM